jgi:hypothetical protein
MKNRNLEYLGICNDANINRKTLLEEYQKFSKGSVRVGLQR